MTILFDITLKTRIGALLDHYPKLEEILINQSSNFKHLKNPVLRNTIAKVTNVQQAAMVAGIPPVLLLQKIKNCAGMDSQVDSNVGTLPYLTDCPKWMEAITSWHDFDVRTFLREGKVPIN